MGIKLYAESDVGAFFALAAEACAPEFQLSRRSMLYAGTILAERAMGRTLLPSPAVSAALELLSPMQMATRPQPQGVGGDESAGRPPSAVETRWAADELTFVVACFPSRVSRLPFGTEGSAILAARAYEGLARSGSREVPRRLAAEHGALVGLLARVSGLCEVLSGRLWRGGDEVRILAAAERFERLDASGRFRSPSGLLALPFGYDPN